MLLTDNGAALRLSDFVGPDDAVKAALELYGPEAQTASGLLCFGNSL